MAAPLIMSADIQAEIERDINAEKARRKAAEIEAAYSPPLKTPRPSDLVPYRPAYLDTLRSLDSYRALAPYPYYPPYPSDSMVSAYLDHAYTMRTLYATDSHMRYLNDKLDSERNRHRNDIAMAEKTYESALSKLNTTRQSELKNASGELDRAKRRIEQREADIKRLESELQEKEKAAASREADLARRLDDLNAAAAREQQAKERAMWNFMNTHTELSKTRTELATFEARSKQYLADKLTAAKHDEEVERSRFLREMQSIEALTSPRYTPSKYPLY